MIYVGNLRSALATDVYTCSGDANGETWAPTLTYHGFRFAEVNVSAAAGVVVGLANVEMVHFASAVTQRANVSFTSATLTKLQTMALGAQRSNFMTVPSGGSHAAALLTTLDWLPTGAGARWPSAHAHSCTLRPLHHQHHHHYPQPHCYDTNMRAHTGV